LHRLAVRPVKEKVPTESWNRDIWGRMKPTRYFTVVLAAVLPVVALASANGCGNKKEDDVPVASATPPPPPPPSATAPATVTPEEPDAGAADADAGDGAVPKPGGGGSYASISRCCAALAQNANSAPLEQRAAYATAAATCNGLRNTPAAHQAFAQIRMFLAGAKMPGACQ
jgi:hypothetical protein